MHYLESPRFQGGNRGNALSICNLIGWPHARHSPIRRKYVLLLRLSTVWTRLRARAIGFFLTPLLGLSSRSTGLADRRFGLGLCCHSNRPERRGTQLLSCFLKANFRNEHFCVLFARAERMWDSSESNSFNSLQTKDGCEVIFTNKKGEYASLRCPLSGLQCAMLCVFEHALFLAAFMRDLM